jgi:hypothetical protein
MLPFTNTFKSMKKTRIYGEVFREGKLGAVQGGLGVRGPPQFLAGTPKNFLYYCIFTV